MARQPYIPLYIGDWERDTNCLSLQAEAAWLKIIFKMFSNGTNGIYKTSTKALQILWKCDTKDLQNILDELRENDVCGIETGENLIFINRRMVREAEISEIRSKAVQTRYKTSTKDIHPSEYDIEYDNENKTVFKDRGVGKGFDLTNTEVLLTIEFIFRTKHRDLTAAQVDNYWKAFSIQCNFLESRGRTVNHFRNWLKKQEHETDKQSPSRSSKTEGAYQAMESLKADIKFGS